MLQWGQLGSIPCCHRLEQAFAAKRAHSGPISMRRRGMDARLAERFRQAAPPVDFCSLRYVSERSEYLAVRQDVVQPVAASEDSGAMLTVYAGGGMGYSAKSDLSLSGLRHAAAQAHDWARLSARQSVVDFSQLVVAPPRGAYSSVELR